MPVDGGCISKNQTHVFIPLSPNDCMRQSHYLINGDISDDEVATVSEAQIRVWRFRMHTSSCPDLHHH